jgi:hypothetical protein
MERVVPHEDPSFPFPGDYPARLRVRVADGRVLERSQMHVAGSAANPMSPAEYESKFVDNASHALDAVRVQGLLARLRELPAVPDMAQVAALYR